MNDKRARLLIVTDESDESRLLQSCLDNDYDLALVDAGETALRRLETHAGIDLVVLSGAPTDMSDVALVREIRIKHSSGSLPLIMLEDGGGPNEIELAFQVGADNCLTRPFTEAALKARIESLLQVKRTFDRAHAKHAELEQSETHRLHICRMASHDLQSPLTNIRLAVKELERAAQVDGAEASRSLVVIGQMAESIEDIMSSYLDVMELHSGKLAYKLTPVNLRDVIVNVVSQFEYSARKKRIQLQIASDFGWVTADAARIVQALGNLVSNAIKYSPYGSTVSIETADEPPYTCVAVTDQGPGIRPAERSRLFQEFGKLSTLPTGGESRTGLGLWIVKQLVEAQEGVVSAEFPDSGGSRFLIRLPATSVYKSAEH